MRFSCDNIIFQNSIVPHLYFGDKDLEQIQQIVTFTKAANLAKQKVGATADLMIMTKKKQLERSNSRPNEE